MILPPYDFDDRTQDDEDNRYWWVFGIGILLALSLVFAYNLGSYNKADEIVSYCSKGGNFSRGATQFTCRPIQEEIINDAG